MGLLDRIGRMIRAGLGDVIDSAEDPEKVLQQAVDTMQANLIQLRQAVAQAIATQKRTERQHAQAQANAQEWYNRAELALQQGNEDLARQALTHRSTLLQSAHAMNNQLQQQAEVVTSLKDNMRTLEAKLAEAKTKKDMFIARARSAEASQRLQTMIGQTNSSTAAFQQLEDKVLDLEAKADALAELNAGDPLEQRFAALETGVGSVDDELATLKAKVRQDPGQIPPSP